VGRIDVSKIENVSEQGRRVLILCTGNSCRSQIAEGLINYYRSPGWQAFSAGIKPSRLNPRAVEAMQEIGIDISAQRSKSLYEFTEQPFDLVITVCDDAAENCPVFPGNRERLHISIPDPAPFTSLPRARAMQHFRLTRDMIKEKVFEALDRYSD